MRVKKFQARDMADAMKMVKAELGPNAIILHSRDMRKGLFGLFASKGVEVTAGIDPRDQQKEQRQKSVAPPKPKPVPKRNGNGRGGSVDFQVGDTAPPKVPSNQNVNSLLALSEKLANERKNKALGESQEPIQSPSASLQPDVNPPKPSQPAKQESPSFREEYLEKRLFTMENQISKLSGLIESLVPSIASGDIPAVPTRTREFYNHLLEQDVDEQLALSIATTIAETTDEEDDPWTSLKAHLTSLIATIEPIELDINASKPKIIMLVGPTGVGKTTTLAKISAQYRYSNTGGPKPKITFITADLYRLAAIEQLQKYTEILGADLEVTYSPDEVRQSIKKHKNANLILFDTAGTCQRNMPQMSTLASIADAALPTEVHLVLSATTKFSDVVDIIEHFKEIKPTRLIFTKIDESTTFGTIFNTSVKYKIPISYLTTGQSVPEDIEKARPERLAKLLLTKPTVNRSIQEEKPSSAEATILKSEQNQSGEASSNTTVDVKKPNRKSRRKANGKSGSHPPKRNNTPVVNRAYDATGIHVLTNSKQAMTDDKSHS